MAQQPFAFNYYYLANNLMSVSTDASTKAFMSFTPFQVYESVSLNTLHYYAKFSGGTASESITISMGLYSLNGSSLSLSNSGSMSLSLGNASTAIWHDMTTFSATQNVTPGAWWFGFNFSFSQVGLGSIGGATQLDPANAFPGAFTGGRMTVTTSVLPASYATSDLDITGKDANYVPNIIISA